MKLWEAQPGSLGEGEGTWKRNLLNPFLRAFWRRFLNPCKEPEKEKPWAENPKVWGETPWDVS